MLYTARCLKLYTIIRSTVRCSQYLIVLTLHKYDSIITVHYCHIYDSMTSHNQIWVYPCLKMHAALLAYNAVLSLGIKKTSYHFDYLISIKFKDIFVYCEMGKCQTCSHTWICSTISIPAKPIHNHDIVSVKFNHFYCTEICDKLRRGLAMFIYIYLNMDDC